MHANMLEAIRFQYALEMVQALPTGKLMSLRAFEEAKKSVTAVAGGEITFDIGMCSGRSETAKVVSRPGDASSVVSYPYTSGIVEEE